LTRVDVWRCAAGEAAEVGELGEAVEPADEEAGVDGTGDGGAGLDGGDDGHVEHARDVLGGQRPTLLDDEDHPVRRAASGGQEAGQGDVAGSPEHGVALAICGRQGAAGGLEVTGPAVDDGDLGPVLLVGRGGEAQGRGHLGPLVGQRERHAEQGGGGGRLGAHQGGVVVAGGQQGEGGGHGCGALAAPCADQVDGAGHRRPPTCD
jgi:hypothetical protein